MFTDLKIFDLISTKLKWLLPWTILLYLLYLLLDMLNHRHFILCFYLLLWHPAHIQVHFEPCFMSYWIPRCVWCLHITTGRHWAGGGGLVQFCFLEDWLLVTYKVAMVLVVDGAWGCLVLMMYEWVLLYWPVCAPSLNSGESGRFLKVEDGCVHFDLLFVKLGNIVSWSWYLRRPWDFMWISLCVGCRLQLPVISPLRTESIVVASLQPTGHSLQHGHVP